MGTDTTVFISDCNIQWYDHTSIAMQYL